MHALANFGCGVIQPEGWVNIDREDFGQNHVTDVFDGLPFDDNTFDGIVANHSLQEIPYTFLLPTFAELHRVLRSGGVLRILVPDPLAAFDAYERADRDWFPIGDDEPSLDDKFCCYLNWFSRTASFFTYPRLEHLLHKAGFHSWVRAGIGMSPLGGMHGFGLETLDSRAPERPLVMEAAK